MSRYFYLEASLPMLKRDESPAMGLEPFLSLCSEWISKSEMDILSQLSMKPEQGLNLSKAPTAAAYLKWEESLRNKLAKSRAVKQGQDPDRYMQPADEFFCEAERIVQESAAASSPLEREKLLDNARWRKLEDLEIAEKQRELFAKDLASAVGRGTGDDIENFFVDHHLLSQQKKRIGSRKPLKRLKFIDHQNDLLPGLSSQSSA